MFFEPLRRQRRVIKRRHALAEVWAVCGEALTEWFMRENPGMTRGIAVTEAQCYLDRFLFRDRSGKS
jgi:hypothetical protein